MTGDGMQDVVLIHNGRIDYWPNLGYGEFGPRVTMHNAPRLPLDYDPRRLLVGDVDGDGIADIIYIENRQLTLWINQGGNSWSSPIVIHGTPAVTDMDSVRLVDLLGTGVSGVLWTQEARGDDRDRYFFFDFTGGIKPYLLTEMNNHIGAVTRVEYAPSTREYLRDQADRSKRWRTPLPFPVQVVSRVEVIDEISKGKLTTEYRYHHGYWDGAEREFRGFGMVEQLDTESFEKYSETGMHGTNALFAAVDRKYFSAPTLTKTWFHQGPVGEEFGLWKEQDYTTEYWRGDPQILTHTEDVNKVLLPLQRRIKRDALRTLRGSILRSELYALDGSALEDRPYTVTEHAYCLREEEKPADNNSSRERIFFPYGTAQRTTQWERGDDPLTQFSFTGQYDAYGQPLSQSALAMPRRSATVEDEAGVLATHTHTVYAEPGTGVDRYMRNRVARSTSFTLTNKPQVSETQPGVVLAVLQDQAKLAKSLHDQFETYLQNWQPIQGATGNYQILAHAVSYYDGTAYIGEDLGKTGLYGALTRSESLVFTDDILNKAYNDASAQRRPAYLGGTATLPPGAPANFGADHGYLDKRNSVAGYVPGYYVSAQQQKYDFQDGADKPHGLPVAMRDALNHASTIDQYDDFQFLPLKVTDPKGMSISAEYNLRVLQPHKVTDPNGNVSEVAFSPSGLVTASWIKGKNGEGDQTGPGSRLAYDFLAFRNTGDPIYVRAIKRCHHDTETDVPLPERNKTIESHEYSDGFGRVIQTRTQGEDVRFGDARLGGGMSVLSADQNDGRGGPVVGIANTNTDPNQPNVVVSGWQVYDNKGKVVEKYEPFFSKGWDFEPETDSRHGVHAEMYYDPRGQVIRTVNPDGSEQRVIYGVPNSLSDPFNIAPTPWEAYTYDPNDNAGRTHPNDAAALGYQHHWNTPASIAIDALGRTVRAVARHREGITTPIEEHLTESSYDMQGNLLAISDALGRHAFSYFYDLAKHALRTGSIDAGTKQVVLNAVGNPIEGHDAKGAVVLHKYDVLNRPTHLWACDKMNDTVTLREKLLYGDDTTVPDSLTHNLRGKLYQHYDEAGVVTVANYDFKGNVLESGRRVISDDFMLANVRAHTGPDWALSAPRVDWATQTDILETTEYRTHSAYDALNRIKWSDCPQAANGERYRLRPEYNRAGVLERVDLEGPLGAGDTGLRQTYVQRLAYNVKGQRTFIAYGNGKITRYAYDPKTFRLVRMRTEDYSNPPGTLSYQLGGGLLQDLAYQYDLGGNILRIAERSPGSGVRNNPRALAYPELQTLLAAGDALVRDFAYDPLYRLISATGRECTIPDPRPVTDDARCGYNSGDHGTANQDNAPDMTSLYEERYEYDPAGNMLRLMHQRPGTTAGWSRYFGMAGFKPIEWKGKVADFLGGNTPVWGTGGNRLTNFGNNEEQSVSHAFDANGNMTRENTERHFEWDQADRMKVFRVQTGTSEPSVYALYLYDSAGMRVKKLVWKRGNYTTTTYLGAAFEHHKEVKPGATQENNHLHVMDDKQRIAIKRVGPAFDGDGAAEHPVQYHLGDHLGSSAVVVSGDGTWINREEFFPYGETSFGSFGRKRYRFTEMERDEESGLNYHGARYYSPSMAIWISPDPLLLDAALNQRTLSARVMKSRPSYTSYSYAALNPLRFDDPTGYQEAEDSGVEEARAIRRNTHVAEVFGEIAPYAEAAASINPLISASEAYTGNSSVEGNRLEWWGRILSIPGIGLVGMIFKPGGRISRFSRGEVVEHIGDVTAGARKEKNVLQKTFDTITIKGDDWAHSFKAWRASKHREVLRTNLQAYDDLSGIVRDARWQPHHIVPVFDKRAKQAQGILRSHKIDIDSSSNGIWLPQGRSDVPGDPAARHSTIHTNEYYENLNIELSKVAKGTREEVLQMLSTIEHRISIDQFPH
jgi:RHS repeat-associated protein